MTLRRKTFAIIAGITFGLVTILYFIMQIFLMNSFTKLEEKHICADMERAFSAINNKLDNMDSTCSDWAIWDDSYNYITGRDSSFFEENLSYGTLANLRLNFMVFIDDRGKVVGQKGYDLKNGMETAVPAGLKKHISPGSKLFLMSESDQSIKGILDLQEDPVMVVCRRITPNNGKGPGAGYLVIGRFIDSEEVQNIINITHLNVAVERSAPEIEGAGSIESVSGKIIHFFPDDEDNLNVFSSIKDIYGQENLILEIRMPREIYRQGKTTILYLLISILVIGLGFILVTIFFLEKSILSRLLRLGTALDEIGRDSDSSARVPEEGNDELRDLAVKINEMIESLEASHVEIKENEEKFHRIFAQSPLGIVLFDAQGYPVEANRAYLDMFGIGRLDELKRFSFAKDPNIRDDIKKKIFSNQAVHFEIEYDFNLVLNSGVYPSAKRGKCCLDCVITPLKISALTFSGFLGQFQNISQRKETEVQLKFLSFYDSLTGLYNRACFEKEIRELERSGETLVSIIMADVDGLKLVNDTFGHDAGDALLTAAAGVLRDSFRKEDVIARIGGDEFSVLLPGHSFERAEKAGERVREAVSRYNIIHRSPFPLSLSIGIASGDITKISINELNKEADNNMYREKLHHNQSTRSEIVQTLMKALRARDGVTEGHGDRLQTLVEDLGRAAGVSEHTIPDLRLFAQFHDIGKVGVADNILFKPTRLTQDEALEMQRHCEIGYRIAQSSQDLAPISTWILHHHEWWDGSGYPMGLKGDNIPLGCRILAIADAYDAMTNNRPYRKALTQAEALAELKKGSGVQFDPRLVDVFICLLKKEGSQEVS